MVIASWFASVIAIAGVGALIGAGVHKGLAWFEVAEAFGLAILTGSVIAVAVVGGALGYTTCHPDGLGLDSNATTSTYRCHSVLWGTETEQRPVRPDLFEQLAGFEETNAAAGAFYFAAAAGALVLLAAFVKFVFRTAKRPPGRSDAAARGESEP